MNTPDQAREQLAKQRQHEEHQHESMLNRAEAEVQTPPNEQESMLERDVATEHRLKEKHLEAAMLTRAAEEAGVPSEKS